MFLGKYEVLDTIGVGGFGRVLLARDPGQVDPSAQLVAIKRLRKARVQRKGSLEAITNEARLGSYLSHPNIVRVIELAQVGRDLLLVMEFINGLGLDELLSQRRLKRQPLPPVISLEIVAQAGRGLHYAHTARSPEGTPLHIVHRDIKPSNIMICRQGIVRVMDFGVARHALPRIQTTTGTIKGTLRYLSPEQAQGVREIGPETDQFALGLVLGEMLIGHPVYDAEHDHQILLKALRCQVSGAIEEAEAACPGIGSILSRALALAPEDRYPHVGAFVEAIEVLQATLPPRASLADWVHQGLEERARLAAEEQQEVLTSEKDPRNLSAPAGEQAEPPVIGASSDVYSVSWADHLRSADASNEADKAGWQIDEEQEPAEPVIAAQADLEGWAMVPASAEDLEWEMLKRTPLTDELVPAELKHPSRRRTRKVTDLSAELAAVAEGERSEASPRSNVAPAARPTPAQPKRASLKQPPAGREPELVPPPRPTSEKTVEQLWSQEDIQVLGSDNIQPLSGEWQTPTEQLPPAESPTAYSVKRPGRDHIVGRTRHPAVPQAPPVVLEEMLASSDEIIRQDLLREQESSRPAGERPSQPADLKSSPSPGGPPALESLPRHRLKTPPPLEEGSDERKGLKSLLRWLVKPREK